MPASQRLTDGLSSPLAGWHESCSFPFATLDAPGPRTPSGVHPPNLFSEVETAKRKQPTQPKPPTASDELLTAHSRLPLATVCVCRLLWVFFEECEGV